MKKKSLLSMLSVFFCLALYGQGGWLKQYENPSSSHTSKVYQTADGGYILITDEELKKVDRHGVESWSDTLIRGVEVAVVRGGYRVLDGSSVYYYSLGGQRIRTVTLQAPPETDKGKIFTEDFELTPDGGYIIIGNTNTNDNDGAIPASWAPSQEGFAGRYDNSGKLLSHIFFTPADSLSIFFRHLLPANDGDFIIWGATKTFRQPSTRADSTAAFIAKLNFNTSISWYTTPFYVSEFTLTDIRKTYDNAYLAVVKKNKWNDDGSVVAKLNNAGGVIWSSQQIDNYSALTVNKDNSFVLASTHKFSSSDRFIEISKFQGTLDNLLWSSTVRYGYGGCGDVFPLHIINTTDGGYGIAGKSENGCFEAGHNTQKPYIVEPFIAKIDKNGDVYTATISGRVYKDSLKDCSFDEGDEPLERVLIHAASTSDSKHFYAYTDSAGHYRLKVDIGTYVVTVSTSTSKYEPIICPAKGEHLVDILSETSEVDEKDFVYQSNPGVRDLTVSLSGGWFPRGRTGTYYISYHNSGTQSESGSLTLSHNLLLSFISSSPIAPFSISSGQVSWNYTDLQPGETRSITVYFNVSPLLIQGTALTAKATIYPIADDKNPADNSYVAENIVGASSDPNAKFVDPKGIGEAGLIKPNTDLLYTVQFQNVGNDTAFFVQVVDTLDETLDLSTLRLLGASHLYAVSIDYPNVLTFTFNNIGLPDSTTNLTASQGFLQYAIKPYKNAPIGAIITNTAHIYFDFNEAVVTNTTINVISSSSSNVAAIKKGVDLIYPNPAFDKVQIRFKAAIAGQVVVRSVTGQFMLEQQVAGNDATLDVSQLAAGLYILEIKAEGGVYSASKFIVQH